MGETAPPGTEQAVLQVLGRAVDLGDSPADAVSASRQVVASGVRVLLGFSVTESTGGATAKVRLRSGTDTSDNSPLLATVGISANGGSLTAWFADEGVEVPSGAVFLEVVSGSVEGCVYVG